MPKRYLERGIFSLSLHFAYKTDIVVVLVVPQLSNFLLGHIKLRSSSDLLSYLPVFGGGWTMLDELFSVLCTMSLETREFTNTGTS